MKTKNVIKQIKDKTGLSNYLLAKQLGIPLSTFYHVAKGDNDISFSVLTKWIEDLGLKINGDQIEYEPYKYVNSFLNLVNKLQQPCKDKQNYYLNVANSMSQLLEHTAKTKQLTNLVDMTKMIKTKEWKAFYAAFVAYVATNIVKKNPPAWTNKKSLVLKQEWSPIKLKPYHTEFDETFKSYNVLLPKGELQWV